MILGACRGSLSIPFQSITQAAKNFSKIALIPGPHPTQSHFRKTASVSSLQRGMMSSFSSSLESRSSVDPIKFHRFDVSNQVFLQRKNTIGIVNLMPIAPLHVLLIPRIQYHRLAQVPKDELNDLFDAVQDVSTLLQSLTNSPSCTIAIQDGKEAGQSVPHLHVHIIPRKDGDFTPKDAIYTHLEEFGLKLHKTMGNSVDAERRLAPDPDQQRIPRSAQEMTKEANWIRQYIPQT